VEAELVSVLEQIERERVFQLLGYESLFVYAVECLRLSPANAYSFGSVARKCRELPSLKQAVTKGTLTVSKAARMVSALTPDNAEELVQFATNHTSREIDERVAQIRPRAKVKDRVKPLSEEWSKLECSVSRAVAGKIQRAQSVLSSKRGRAVDLNETLEAALDSLLAKHDPVQKAKRAKKRDNSQSPFCPGRTTANKRTPLTAEQKHSVNLRDRGQCAFVHPGTGQRCSNDRWLHTHHIQEVQHGGDNHPDNLVTLCAVHHDLVHQLSLPIESIPTG